jgi:biopolymer transport protein ExbB/TolQ
VEQVIATGPDYSVYGLVMQADPVVKGVMLLLVIASVACWAIILEKVVRLTGLSRSIRQLEDAEMGHLDQRSTRPLVRAVLRAAQSEIEDGAARGESRSEMRDRIERAMRDALKSELRRLEVGHHRFGGAIHRIVRDGLGHRP